MNNTIQIVLKCLAVVFALAMLSGYVWTRQRAVSPEIQTGSGVNEATGFPVTPDSPMLFDTSKSGKLTVDPVLFSTSKSGPVDLGVTLVPEGGNKVSEDDDEQTESDSSPAPILIPGSKSINMPIFNTKEVTKVITPIEELIEKAKGSTGDSE